MSTETLVRGVNILRNSTMTLENDPAYQEMIAERNRLMVPYMNWQHSSTMNSVFRKNIFDCLLVKE